MNFKKITSLSLLLSFLIVLLSTIVLYIAPPGFYSRWGGWEFLFIGRDLWRALHIVIGFVFLIFLFIHMAYNFKLIVKYIKKAGSNFISKEMAAAVIIIGVSSIGTAYDIQPFKGVMDLSSKLKMSWVKKYEAMPFRNAESSTLEVLARKTNKNIEDVKKLLEVKGFKNIDSRNTLLDIASSNKISPNDVYRIILGK
jgi:energy-coupling factor transporter transmembrane protein EcfT